MKTSLASPEKLTFGYSVFLICPAVKHRRACEIAMYVRMYYKLHSKSYTMHMLGE